MAKKLTATITLSFEVPDSVVQAPRLAEDEAYVLNSAAEGVYGALPDDFPEFDIKVVAGSVALALS